MNNRKLTLNRESLTELSNDDLSAVVGAEAPDLPDLPTLDGGVNGLAYCITLAGSRCIY